MVPKRVAERMISGLKALRPIIENQKTRDVSEADTVTLVKDVMADVFGYDKYAELTSEYSIRGTYCDLAVKLNDRLVLLVEVKAIGTALDDRHVKQAIDYAANQGVEWVILTNAICWRLYHVVFAKPIDKVLVSELDLLTIDARKERDSDSLFPLTKEGIVKGAHVALRDRQAATSRFMMAALLIHNDSVLANIKRELKRTSDVTVEPDEIKAILCAQVIKREALEGPEAEAARKAVDSRERKLLRVDKGAEVTSSPEVAPTVVVPSPDCASQP